MLEVGLELLYFDIVQDDPLYTSISKTWTYEHILRVTKVLIFNGFLK